MFPPQMTLGVRLQLPPIPTSRRITPLSSSMTRFVVTWVPWLYTPADFLARCPGASTMVECAQTAGWPTIGELRGKFIVNVIGNWSTTAYDWVVYATSEIE